ncbi:MAG: TolC family protein [Bacteroidales bacterium]|nr:TolC family protein [Bacteroidales bacterium]
MKISIFIALILCALTAKAQTLYTLSDCKRMALDNNVAVRNAANSLEAAEQTRQESFTQYFPTVSATGMGFIASKGLVEMGEGEQKVTMLKDGWMGGVMLSQPVFAGGQIVNGNRLAQKGVTVNRLQHRMSSDEVLLTVEQYYWQLVMLKEKLATIETIATMLDRLSQDVEMAVKAGINTRNDLLQVQLRQGDTKSSRINLEYNISVCRRLFPTPREW